MAELVDAQDLKSFKPSSEPLLYPPSPSETQCRKMTQADTKRRVKYALKYTLPSLNDLFFHPLGLGPAGCPPALLSEIAPLGTCARRGQFQKNSQGVNDE